ncbi:MAG: thiamine-binding protein [Bacteroidota bacterium]|nr:thiamine-binding protein [Bacteroidota bacterium]
MQINAAIQLLPLITAGNKYDLIDAAIVLIKNSGLHCRVCPFETVVEGEAKEVYKLIEQIQNETLKAGCDELLINIKIHAANRNLSFEDKVKKFE